MSKIIKLPIKKPSKKPKKKPTFSDKDVKKSVDQCGY
jgi:hypothetical protein